MGQRVGRGGTIILPAFTRNGSDILEDAPDLKVDILDPSNNVMVVDATPDHIATGIYQYEYTVDGAAPLGFWTAHWTCTINAEAVQDDDDFQVVVAGFIQFQPNDDFDYLRTLLDDQVKEGMKNFFDDTQLASILSRHGQQIYSAAADGWAMKAAYYSRRIDVSKEGNNTRPYSQLYRNAIRMADHYTTAVKAGLGVDPAMSGRVVGVPISLRETPVWMQEFDRLVERG